MSLIATSNTVDVGQRLWSPQSREFEAADEIRVRILHASKRSFCLEDHDRHGSYMIFTDRRRPKQDAGRDIEGLLDRMRPGAIQARFFQGNHVFLERLLNYLSFAVPDKD
jgi:hypothetical protein